jgi:hypothetical protein
MLSIALQTSVSIDPALRTEDFDDGVGARLGATLGATRGVASVNEAARAGKPDWLKVVQLDRENWRISDARVEVADNSGLLGFIERISSRRYEILWMTDPLRWAYEGSFDAAVRGFFESVRFGGTVLAERERWEIPRSANSSRRVLKQIKLANRGGGRTTQLED